MMFKIFSPGLRFLAGALLLVLLGAVFLLAGCQTGPGLTSEPVDLTDPGLTVKSGQAIWRRPPDLELAGELVVAFGPGKELVHFTKGHMGVVTARREGNGWSVEFFSEKRYRGRGRSPARIGWLHLPGAVERGKTPRGWSWSQEGERWKLENRKTGEAIEGFFEEGGEKEPGV
jgi:hypothetical protein